MSQISMHTVSQCWPTGTVTKEIGINDRDQEVQISSNKRNESWDEIYSIGNVVIYTVIFLYDDSN